QDLILSQYMTNLLPTNAAYAGTSGNLNATLISRNQWVGFEGAPQTNVLLINSPLIKRNFGVGLTLIQDKVGPLVQTLVFGDAAYNFQLTEKIRLSMGVKAGFNVQQPDFGGLDLSNPNDPTFAEVPEVELLPNFGFGLFMYNPKYYFGISSPKLKKNELNFGAVGEETGGEERHYFVIGGYVFDLKENLKYKPTFFYKMVNGAPPSFEISNTFIYKDKIWLGAFWRVGDAIGTMLQYNINRNLKVGYSYDYSITELSSVSSGTHEVLLSYDLVFRANKIVTPRYF
ncbi:MAG: type IX secretion system membrane protein PorP/SprF, partial [Bacteroidales bacterium]|nr:type IX secretion system membrane protein PorP/SprF [Bacteroidales bacterium]